MRKADRTNQERGPDKRIADRLCRLPLSKLRAMLAVEELSDQAAAIVKDIKVAIETKKREAASERRDKEADANKEDAAKAEEALRALPLVAGQSYTRFVFDHEHQFWSLQNGTFRDAVVSDSSDSNRRKLILRFEVLGQIISSEASYWCGQPHFEWRNNIEDAFLAGVDGGRGSNQRDLLDVFLSRRAADLHPELADILEEYQSLRSQIDRQVKNLNRRMAGG